MKRVALEDLKPGMVAGEDVYAVNGQLLASKGMALTELKLQMLRVYAVHSIRIMDEKNTVDLLLGKDISGFTSKFPPEVREARIQEIQEYKKSYDEGTNYFQVALNSLVSKNTDMNANTVLEQTTSLLRPTQTSSDILDMFIYLKEYDSNVYSHSINVSLLCNMLAQWLGYSEEECRMALACGMFHDIGKLSIPEIILHKSEPLTPAEEEIVKTHPQKGYQILQEHDVAEDVMLSALMHHERCDGSGYPDHLTVDAINPYAKLVTICDIYDAMTFGTPSQKPKTPFAVLEKFESEGFRKYDTRPLLVFMENTANTYLNSAVRLSNGAVGYVVYINKNHLGRPTVQCGDDFIDLSAHPELIIAEMLPVV